MFVYELKITELFEYKFNNVPDYETITFYMDEEIYATKLDSILGGLSFLKKEHFRNMSGVYYTPLFRLIINGDYNLRNYEALLEVMDRYSE